MPLRISPLAEVHPDARLGADVEIGPFCLIGPDVSLGEGTILESHVVVTGRVELGQKNRIAAYSYLGPDTSGPSSSQTNSRTTLGDRNVLFPRVTICAQTRIGDGNQFFDNATIGRAPQDTGYQGGLTAIEIGDDNIFRENVTVNRGAEKEDGWTRIGHRNYCMENSHVGHNCRIGSHVMLANNVALAGHVHIQDRVIIGGNTAIHQFATVGTLAFVGGITRVTTDVPPYMMFTGTEDNKVSTLNLVGLRRNGVSEETIKLLRLAHRLVYREFKTLATVREIFDQQLECIIPIELANLFNALEFQRQGVSGRGREAIRKSPAFVFRPVEEHRNAA